MPSYPGTFTGELLHSAAYWSSEALRGKRVLVIGGGNSGFDIACDAAKVAARAALSVRRGYWVFPKHLFGQPVDVLLQQGPHLPNWLAQPVLAGVLRMAVGRQDRFGLPAPDHKPLESHPVLNTQVFHYLSHGDLDEADVIWLRGRAGALADGSASLRRRALRDRLPPRGLPAARHLRPRASGGWRPITGAFVGRRIPVPGMFETNSGGYLLYDKPVSRRADGARPADDAERPGATATQEDVDLRGGIVCRCRAPRTTSTRRRWRAGSALPGSRAPTEETFDLIRRRRLNTTGRP
jgi:hypothetical protein